jgi:HD-like signal output (HDOD) protein
MFGMPDDRTIERTPGPPAQVLVRCADFQCLAYQDASGEWRSVFGDSRIPNVLEVLSPPDGVAPAASLSGQIDALLDQVDQLPPAPRILPRLLSALSDTQTNVNEVVDLVALDTVLTARLLRTCNSAYFGTSEPVEDVSQAVHRLGYETVYRIVAVVNGSDCFNVPGLAQAEADRLWRHSVTTGFGALFVAEDVGLEGGALFTAGILHDLGKVVLAGVRRGRHALPNGNAAGVDGEAPKRHTTTFGFSHAEVGGRMLERWHFSGQLAVGVRFHHSPTAAGDGARFAACIALANALAHHVDDPKAQALTSPGAALALDILGLAPEDLEGYDGRIRENLLFAEVMCRA